MARAIVDVAASRADDVVQRFELRASWSAFGGPGHRRAPWIAPAVSFVVALTATRAVLMGSGTGDRNNSSVAMELCPSTIDGQSKRLLQALSSAYGSSLLEHVVFIKPYLIDLHDAVDKIVIRNFVPYVPSEGPIMWILEETAPWPSCVRVARGRDSAHHSKTAESDSETASSVSTCSASSMPGLLPQLRAFLKATLELVKNSRPNVSLEAPRPSASTAS